MKMKSPIVLEAQINKLPYLMGMHYFTIPSQTIKVLGGKMSVRLKCTVNEVLTYQCGIVALGNGDGYISINQTRMKKLKVKEGDFCRIAITLDNSVYGIDVPQELEAVFDSDVDGKKRFDLMSAGRKRNVIYYISAVKNSQLRIERALNIINNIKQLPIGKESYKGIYGIE